MKNILLFLIVSVLLIFTSCNENKTRDGKPVVLVFSKTVGYRHQAIPNGIAAIQKLGNENNFKVDTTSNALNFNEENLEKYAAVIFLNTTLNILDYKQEISFERYIQSGGGFVGVHAAADTEYDWKWYGRLVGAYFKSHPRTQEANFIIKDKSFSATNFFTDSIWKRTDELYNFYNFNPDVNILISIDENSYEGGENGDFHPMSWYHEYDGGRAFYTELGHTKESYVEKNYLKHLLGGIQYAIGENKKLNYAKARSQYPPDEDRFVKKQLAIGAFFEPTEMTILPNLDVLIAQRRGELMLYKKETNAVSQVGFLDVYHKTLNTPGVNAEEGLMGLQKDPNFHENNWIYLFYSPSGDKWINRLSRFVFKNDILDISSEVVILELDSQREICCHTGGSIAFGPDGLLYLSTGDNTTPFDEKGEKYVNNGFAPLNDVPGHEQYDGRRTSGNTNDLRGKVLRIKLNDDGTYAIPKGNLFPVGTDKTRPEIYTMGHRNPYRISVDQKNSNLYWGDVGPDSSEDKFDTRGPRGYDEVGQAREAGNFGWPLFIANNKPYHAYNYETGESGELFDAKKPRNNSRNNTGLTELPEAKSAFIWYPYNNSNEFPQLGSGSRNAMAGPVYYSDLYPKETALPIYYNGKLIIYEWMRGWMKAVTLRPNGDFDKMEPFAPEINLKNLIDMEVGPDGRIYLLEYGSGWFSKNDDSGLAYIDFNGGNRVPIVKKFEVDNTSGVLPLSINVKVDARDRENDTLKYLWDFGNGTTQETDKPQIDYVYTIPGEYSVSVDVIDSKGATVKSNVIPIFAGNERPKVIIEINGGNKSFFIPGQEITYNVSVEDADEPSGIDESNIYVSFDYMEGMDEASLSVGHQKVAASVMGKVLTQSMDCKACHKESEKSIGPSFKDVSKKYQKNKNANAYLQEKIIKGGSGVWGEVAMAAHPDISKTDLSQITTYILALENSNSKKESLPASGSIIPESAAPGKSIVITASYTDKGTKNVRPLTGLVKMIIPSNNLKFTKDSKMKGFVFTVYEGTELIVIPSDNGWFASNKVDLTGVKYINLTVAWQELRQIGLSLEAHLNAPDGKLIGKGSIKVPVKGQEGEILSIKIDPITDGKLHEVYFTFTSLDTSKESLAAIDMMNFAAE